MKLCIISEFTCNFSNYKAMIEGRRDEVMQYCTEMTLAQVSEHESIMVADVTDPAGLQAHMSTPEAQKWDKDNGCVDKVFFMEPAPA